MLSYYQAVELMDCLPLISSFNADRDEQQLLNLNEKNGYSDNTNILEMPEPWHLFSGPAEANGEYFTGH